MIGAAISRNIAISKNSMTRSPRVEHTGSRTARVNPTNRTIARNKTVCEPVLTIASAALERRKRLVSSVEALMGEAVTGGAYRYDRGLCTSVTPRQTVKPTLKIVDSRPLKSSHRSAQVKLCVISLNKQ